MMVSTSMKGVGFGTELPYDRYIDNLPREGNVSGDTRFSR